MKKYSFMVLILSAFAAQAIPPQIGTTDYTGQGSCRFDIDINSRAAQSGLGMYRTNYPTTGNPRVPVILVEYQDVKFSTRNDAKDYFTRMMNGENFTDYGAIGSVAEYFRDQSDGKFVPEFDVYGPVTLPENREYYGSNYGQGWDAKAHYMVSHALKILDKDVDFSKYDANGDGDIDFVYIFYAGQGENRGGGEDTVWPHAGNIKSDGDFVIVDGVWGNYYACSNELISEESPEGMCAFIHEYSHILGLPDLYPSDSNIYLNEGWDYTVGQYSIMDYGVYNQDGRVPPNFTAYERNALKWGEPIVIENAQAIELDDISTGTFYLVPTERETEFFLLENRQQTGWDSGLPGHGLLVWHIDYDKDAFENNNVNNLKEHQRVELIKANGEILFGTPLSNQEGFPFPGTSGHTEFTASSTPAFLSWTGNDPGFPLTKIREVNGKVRFCVAGAEDNFVDEEPGEEPGSEEEPDAGVNGIIPDREEEITVYFLSGVRLINRGDRESIKNLPAGLYIINGKKVKL